MNKLFIILLAIGLASAHTFVKRDAPAATTENFLAGIEKEFQALAGKMGEAFDAENIKKNFNQAVDKFVSVTKNLKPGENKQ